MPLADRLLRSVLLAAAAALLVVLVPAVGVLVWAWAGDGRLPGFAGWPLAGVVLVALTAVAALGSAAWVARREAARLTGPLAALGAQADAIGRRPNETPLRTGVEEVDAVSEVLRTRALELSRRLAAEHEFAADASHQLRTPLTALLIRLEEISLVDDPDEMREEASICIDQVERLTRVVDDLMRHTRSAVVPQDEGTSLDSVLAELQREWQPAYSKARRAIRITGARGLRLRVPRDDLAQMISTLLENALQHGQGRVTIDGRRTGPSVIVEVSDEGRGVDPGLAPHVFERRVTTSGSGLGLALARDLAQSAGGRLELLSSQPARFALFLSEHGAGSGWSSSTPDGAPPRR